MRLATVTAICIEIIMRLGILTGVVDRLAALIMACAVTALLWEQFWKPGDLWSAGSGWACGLFRNFLRNVSFAGGSALVTFGTDSIRVGALLSHSQASSNPYAAHQTVQ